MFDFSKKTEIKYYNAKSFPVTKMHAHNKLIETIGNAFNCNSQP
jgi:hypothetical protein